MLPAMVEWEHDGATTAAVEAAAHTTDDILGDGPTTIAEDDADVPQVAYRPGGTLVGHPQNHLPNVLT
jgi:hypothetical protein